MRCMWLSLSCTWLFVAAVCADVCETWQESYPAGRSGHAMAYDSNRRVIVLFGGRGTDANNVTWEWHGEGWKQRHTPVFPPSRHGTSMAFDSARGVAVLFGGIGFDGFLNDTWEWDGETWTHVASTGPSPRADHAMVYDAARGQILLAGGRAIAGSLGDTWVWDGASWTREPGSGVGARFSPAMAYDGSRGKVVLHGGSRTGAVVLDDTLEWDGSDWTPLTSGPVRTGHAMAYDPLFSRVVLFGGSPDGSGAGETNEMWTLADEEWSLIDDGVDGPAGIRGAKMVYDLRRLGLVVFGGARYADYASGDTWGWGLAGWERLSSPPPPRRTSPAVAFDGNLGETLMFGGYGSLSGPFGDTWSWNGRRWMLRATGGPAPSQLAAMAFDTEREVMLLFDSTEDGPRTWAWDGADWTLISEAGPTARQCQLAFDEARGRAVMFTGWSHTDPTSQTWEWDGQDWTQVASDGPAPRFSHTMAYDASRGVTVLFAGTSGVNHYDDTWEWDGTSWTLVDDDGPGRVGHTMIYDPDREVVRVFGGTYDDESRQTWEWDGQDWIMVSESGPFERNHHGMAYDPIRQRTVICAGSFGIGTPERMQDAWEFGPDLRFLDQAADLSREIGGRAVFLAAADGDGPPQYQWTRDGEELTDNDTTSGTQTARLTIDPVGEGDFGTYVLVISNECATMDSAPVELSCVGAGCPLFVPGDVDGDGDVDLDDYTAFEACLAGPGSELLPECGNSDVDADGDADLMDFQVLQAGFTGSPL